MISDSTHAPEVPGHGAHEGADDDDDQLGHQPDGEGDPRPVDEPREEVAPQMIRAEQVLARGAGVELEEVLPVVRMRQPSGPHRGDRQESEQEGEAHERGGPPDEAAPGVTPETPGCRAPTHIGSAGRERRR